MTRTSTSTGTGTRTAHTNTTRITTRIGTLVLGVAALGSFAGLSTTAWADPPPPTPPPRTA